MNFLSSLILGVVEGLTEFLPVSSTAHLLITEKLLGLVVSDFTKTFTISIQLGAILAVVVLYWRRLWSDRELWAKLLAAFIPTAVLGLLFYKIIKTYLLEDLPLITWALLIGGIVIVIFELIIKKRTGDNQTVDFSTITYKKAMLIGLAQCAAFVPGVSRSAATILGGLSLKINRQTIVAFSFMLAVPTMLAATGLDLLKNAGSFSGAQIELWLVGFIASFIVALAVIKGFIKFVAKHSFIAFGIYRIILGLILLLSL
jgi:undecaprenyl-diphosphatase